MDTQRTDLLLQFILLTAAHADEWRDRELGPIHLLKYAYLADLAFAERHDGATFTGTAWQFYHFGPWQAEVHNRIEPALIAIGATVKQIPSRYEGDFVRYVADRDNFDESALDRTKRELPLGVVGAVESAFRQHGSDTSSLLHHVYLTRPMLRAAPGELLVLAEEPRTVSEPSAVPAQASKREQRARAEAIKTLKARVQERLRERIADHAATPPPRYDEVFVAGTNWLDSLAGEPLRPQKGELQMDESIWKSSQRTEPDVP